MAAGNPGEELLALRIVVLRRLVRPGQGRVTDRLGRPRLKVDLHQPPVVRDRLDEGTLPTDFRPLPLRVPYHAPCQQRGHAIGKPALDLLALIPELDVVELDTDCCGIAGTYGIKREKYEIGMRTIKQGESYTIEGRAYVGLGVGANVEIAYDPNDWSGRAQACRNVDPGGAMCPEDVLLH